MALIEWNIYEQPQRLLTEADALVLLARWLLPDNSSEQERTTRIAELRASLPETAYGVMQECHYMPLALVLCAALIQEGLSWGSVLDALHKADAKFHDHPHTGILKALQISLDTLRQQNPDDAFQPHLSIQIIQHSLRIMGWVFPDWHEIYELLSY
jgi:hypothetical protein